MDRFLYIQKSLLNNSSREKIHVVFIIKQAIFVLDLFFQSMIIHFLQNSITSRAKILLQFAIKIEYGTSTTLFSVI
jgi:hypothetical protein